MPRTFTDLWYKWAQIKNSCASKCIVPYVLFKWHICESSTLELQTELCFTCVQPCRHELQLVEQSIYNIRWLLVGKVLCLLLCLLWWRKIFQVCLLPRPILYLNYGVSFSVGGLVFLRLGKRWSLGGDRARAWVGVHIVYSEVLETIIYMTQYSLTCTQQNTDKRSPRPSSPCKIVPFN